MGKIINNYYFKLIFSCFLAGLVMSLSAFELIAMKAEGFPILGAFLQGFGLLTVLALNLYLFNSHVCDIYFEKNKVKVIIEQVMAIFINLASIVAFAYLIRLMTSNNEKLIKAANEIANARLINVGSFVGKEWYMSFIASLLCGFMLGLARFVYKQNIHQVLKVLTIFLAVGLYVIMGFENLFTNVFYITYAGIWNLATFYESIIVLLGNFLGLSFIYFTFSVAFKKEKKQE